MPQLPLSFSITLFVAMALVPAVVAWRTGRVVLARADDPLLPELLFERGQRLATLTLGWGIGVAIFTAADAPWVLLVLWLGLLVAAYPLRRALYGERLGALAFLRYSAFSTIGHDGLRLFSAAAPALATSLALSLAPDDSTAAVRIAAFAGVAAVAIAVVWRYNFSRVFLALHRATPFHDSARPELVARLDDILDRAAPSRLKRPAVFRYGVSGAYVMSACYIPSVPFPAIAFGDTLLATLTDDEIVGVFAHEVAHHEQFKPSRWRRSRWSFAALCVLLAALPPLVIWAAPHVAIAASWAMMPFILIFVASRTTRRRAAETASDLRALALSGNVDTLISALTKLHLYSRVPRRWPHSIERAATHPSLARRIQALRDAAGVGQPEAHAATQLSVFRSLTEGLVVAFDRDRAYWFEGVPAGTPPELHGLREAASSYRGLAYGDLTELRVGAAGEERTIEARDRDGQSLRAPISPNDVPAIQAVLDGVDGKLAPPRPAVVPGSSTLMRWYALTILLMLMVAGEMGVVLVPVLFVFMFPSVSAALAATAAIAIERALLAAHAVAWVDHKRLVALLVAFLTAILLIVDVVSRVRSNVARGRTRRLTREAWAVAGLLAGVAAAMGILFWPLLRERPLALISHPLATGMTTALVGAGAALITIPSRWWRLGGALTTTIALAGVVLGANGGQVLRRIPPLMWTSRRLTPIAAARVPGGGVALRTSPNGSAFAVKQYRPLRGERAGVGARYLIGRFDDSTRTLRTTAATTVVFLDEEIVLALDDSRDDSLELRAERVRARPDGTADVLWRQSFGAIDAAELLIDRAHRAWVVVGLGDSDYSFLIFTDTLGGMTPRSYRLGKGEPRETLRQPLVAFPDGGAILFSLARSDSRHDAVASVLTMVGTLPWELRGADAAGEHSLADIEGIPYCARELDAQGALCVEQGVSGSRVWRAASTRSVSLVADLPPGFDLVGAVGTDRVVAAEQFGARAAVVDAATRKAFRLTLPGVTDARQARRSTVDLAARGDYLMVLFTDRSGATVMRFGIEQP